MAEYRVRLTLTGPIATPLYSGTLFGHLCWAKLYREGESALTRWLADLPQDPWLLSDALPADHLPRPLLAPGPHPEPAPGELRDVFCRRLERYRRLRKTAWITVTDFLELRACLNETRLLEQLAVTQREAGTQETPGQGRRKRVQLAHHTINRLTGTAPEAGGLYFTDEDWGTGKACELDVYVITAMNAAAVQALFTQIGEFGYGRDANLGRGQFTAEVETANPGLFDHTGNRLLSLSHGMVSTNMTETLYRLHTHYGKLGGLYAGSAYPFKYPLLLTRPGATFTPLDRGPFGKLLSGVHPRHPQIYHNAWHLCLPFTAA